MAQTQISVRRARGGVFSAVKQTILAWFTNLFGSSRSIFWNIGNREVFSDIDATTAIDKGFSANAAVYSIVMRDIDKFASIPRYLFDPKTIYEKSKKAPTQFKSLIKAQRLTGGKNVGALSRLLERPNPYQGQAQFLKTTRGYYDMCGEAFIWLNRGETVDELGNQLPDSVVDLMPVFEMYPLPSHLVEIISDPENLWGNVGFLLQVAGSKMPLRKNDIVHWKNVNLQWDAVTRVHMRGMPPLKPGASVLDQNTEAAFSATRMYENDGAKGAVTQKVPAVLTPEQQSQIQTVINRKINNSDVKGAIAALQGDWGYLNFGGTSVDMQLLEGKKISMMELCFLWGVPYTMFDPNTAYANAEWQQKNWVSNLIIPACKELDDELNRVILKAFLLEGIAIIQSDWSELRELQEDYGKLASWLKDATNITPNEGREMLGFEAYAHPLMDEPWLNGKPISQWEKEFEGDGIDELASELGLSNYALPAVEQPAFSTNGKH